MKLLLTIICLLAFNAFSVSAEEKPNLQLMTEILSQKYCVGDFELDRLDLQLKLRFENRGNQPIILYKDSRQVDQTIIKKTSDEFSEREVSTVFTWVWSGEWKIEESSLGKSFVILQPNETYETQTVTGVFTPREGVGKISGAVGDGEHFLQIRVSTWYGSRELADRLQQTWKQSGYLWTNSVLSQPMKFKIDAKRKVVRCE